MCKSPLKYFIEYIETQAGPSPSESAILTSLNNYYNTAPNTFLIVQPAQASQLCCPCPTEICSLGGYILSGMDGTAYLSRYLESIRGRFDEYGTRCCLNVLGSIQRYIVLFTDSSGPPVNYVYNSCCSDYRQFDISIFGFTNSDNIETITNTGIFEYGAFYLKDLGDYFIGKSESFKLAYLTKILEEGFTAYCLPGSITFPITAAQGSIVISSLYDSYRYCEAVG